MSFQLLSILDTMISLYQTPIQSRFQTYLSILQGNTKGDLVVPIGNFNPMAKEHILQQLLALKHLDIEKLVEDILKKINEKESFPATIKVAFNLADDLMGGWTNRFTTDYDSKFKIGALVARNFCTPIFWSSEVIDAHLIEERTAEYAYRTLYWQQKPKPNTLREHLEQEKWVAQKMNYSNPDFKKDNFYQTHQNSEEYALIFNFLYGDLVSRQLGFMEYGNFGISP